MTETPGAMQEIKKLNSELAGLNEAISRLRKQGKDVFIAQLLLTAIPPKLKMAEATLSEKDLAKARSLIGEASKELGSGVPAGEPEEIFKNPAAASSAFQQVKNCIAQAEKAARLGNREQAAKLYNLMREKFPLLRTEEKKEAVSACRDLLAQLGSLHSQRNSKETKAA